MTDKKQLSGLEKEALGLEIGLRKQVAEGQLTAEEAFTIFARGLTSSYVAEIQERDETIANLQDDVTILERQHQSTKETNADLIQRIETVESAYTKKVEAEAAAKKEALTDDLTGLLNDRGYHQKMEEAISRGERYGNPFSLIIFDLDHFKDVNDAHGHLVGSNTLTYIAEIVSSEIRNIDHAARYGGDEYVIILTETDLEGGYQVAERIRRRVAEKTEQHPELPKVTITSGVAEYWDNASGDDVFNAADKALYRAKEGGRNRTEAYLPNEKKDELDIGTAVLETLKMAD